MVASALHQPAGIGLLRERVRWPVSPQRLYEVVNLPAGFRAEISGGRLRIGHPDRRIDDALVDLGGRLATEVPGIRFEMYAGWIVVSGPPKMRHHRTVLALFRQLHDLLQARSWDHFQTVGLIDPATRAYAIPDLVIARPGAPEYDECLCGNGVLLAVEVTSTGGAQDDRTHKWVFYGQARVPLYLLVDQELGEVALHSGPFNGGYRNTVTVSLGKPLTLPDPFGITIDTSALQP